MEGDVQRLSGPNDARPGSQIRSPDVGQGRGFGNPLGADVEKLLDALVELRERANVNACFGEPVTVEGRTVIPVARAGYGFGMGLGQEPTAGGRAASPVAVIEVTSEGTRIEPVVDRQMAVVGSMLVGAWRIFWVARAFAAIFGRGE